MKTTIWNNQWLIVVDYEHCFANPEINELYVQWGETLAPYIREVIQEIKQKGWKVIGTRDWHTRERLINFAGNFVGKKPLTEVWPTPEAFITPKEVQLWTPENNLIAPRATFTLEELQKAVTENGVQVLWPDHGVANTLGGEFYNLDPKQFDAEVLKWTDLLESYSWFGGKEKTTNRPLEEILRDFAVKWIVVVGLATDYCVKATALEAKKLGYQVQLLLKWIAAVNPATEVEALKEMREAGIQILD